MNLPGSSKAALCLHPDDPKVMNPGELVRFSSSRDSGGNKSLCALFKCYFLKLGLFHKVSENKESSTTSKSFLESLVTVQQHLS